MTSPARGWVLLILGCLTCSIAFGAAGAGTEAAPSESLAEPPTAVVLPAEHECLLRAIQELRLIEFDYGGFRRVFEPHAYGVGSSGEAVLHGFQLEGESSSASPPGWRTFTVAEMSALVVSTRRFSQARPGFAYERFALDPLWAVISPTSRAEPIEGPAKTPPSEPKAE